MPQSPGSPARFQIDDSVSTMCPIGQRGDGGIVWDLCCAGKVERIEERDGAFHYAVQGLAAPHFHREDEVAEDGAIDARVNWLNNEPSPPRQP